MISEGFDWITLPYLPYVIGQICISSSEDPDQKLHSAVSYEVIRIYTVCHSPSNCTDCEMDLLKRSKVKSKGYE